MVWELGGAVGRRIRGMSKPARASPAASEAQQMTPLGILEAEAAWARGGCGRSLQWRALGRGEALAASHATRCVAIGRDAIGNGKNAQRAQRKETKYYTVTEVAIKERRRARAGDGVVRWDGTFSRTLTRSRPGS